MHDPAAASAARHRGGRRRSPLCLTSNFRPCDRFFPLWTHLRGGIHPFVFIPGAKAVIDYIRQYGASFFDELVEGTGLLRPQVEEALGELVALGMVASDSFAGVRALLRKP